MKKKPGENEGRERERERERYLLATVAT